MRQHDPLRRDALLDGPRLLLFNTRVVPTVLPPFVAGIARLEVPKMSKRILALALPVLLCVTSLALAAQASSEQHRGELMAVDKDAKTITVKIMSNTEKETHVYKVVDGVTIIRDANMKVITFADLKAGVHLNVVSKKEKGDRIAKEITLKADKKKH